MNKKKFPVYIDLSDKKIVVAGGGNIGCRRIMTLMDFCDDITVVSPKILPSVKPYIEDKKIRWSDKTIDAEDIKDADIVIAATNDKKLNEKIYLYCKENGIMVNNASNQNQCDFQFPAVIQYENIVIGLNSGGADHKKVKNFRIKLENFLKTVNFKNE